MQSLINWQLLHKRLSKKKRPESEFLLNWDEFAEMYDGMIRLEARFSEQQVACLPIEASDTVVDIGSGPGRLSVPLAHRAHQVTAVDAFPNMLARCMKNAKNAGVDNIKALLQDWEAEDALEQIGMHDIAIASRSVGLADLKKLNKIARKYAIIIAFANAPSLKQIHFEFLEGMIPNAKRSKKANDRAFSYNITYNMLYDMGAEPNVLILDDGFEAIYNTKQEAYDDLTFMGNIQPDVEHLFHQNIDKHLTATEDNRWKLFCPTRSFVMWWKTSDIVA